MAVVVPLSIFAGVAAASLYSYPALLGLSNE